MKSYVSEFQQVLPIQDHVVLQGSADPFFFVAASEFFMAALYSVARWNASASTSSTPIRVSGNRVF